MSELILRIAFPGIVLRLAGQESRLLVILAAVAGGLLFSIAHPLQGFQVWWLGMSVITSVIVFYSDCVLFGWLVDAREMSDYSRIGGSAPYLIGLVAAYIIIAAAKRLLFRKHELVPEAV